MIRDTFGFSKIAFFELWKKLGKCLLKPDLAIKNDFLLPLLHSNQNLKSKIVYVTLGRTPPPGVSRIFWMTGKENWYFMTIEKQKKKYFSRWNPSSSSSVSSPSSKSSKMGSNFLGVIWNRFWQLFLSDKLYH